MKNCFSWIGRSIVLGGLMAGTVGVGSTIAADDYKNPTDAEIQKLRADTKEDVRVNGLPRPNQRNLDDRTFIESWKGANPEVVPFIGGWGYWVEGVSIYPSRKRGIVCFVRRQVTMPFEFIKGKVEKGVLRLENGDVYIVEQDLLVWFRRKYERPFRHPPSSLSPIIESHSDSQIHKNSENEVGIATMAKAEGCQSTPPQFGQQPYRRNNTIENLPDGDYRYKKSIGQQFYSLGFRKQGKMISACEGNMLTLDWAFVGEISGNSITKGYTTGLGYNDGKAGTSEISSPTILDSYTPFTIKDSGRNSGSEGMVRKHLDQPIFYKCEDEIGKLNQLFVQKYSASTESIQTAIESSKQTPIAPQPTANSRPPNAQEVALLDRTIQNSKAPNLSRNQSIDRQTLQSRSSRFVKPFAGGWMSSDNQKYYVYPSTRKERQACILIEKDGTQDLQIGVANGNSSGTDINIGTSRMFKTKEDRTVLLRLYGRTTLIPLYASAISANINPGNLEMMQENGCMTSFPGVDNGTIASKTTQPDPPKQISTEVCPSDMFAASVPPRQEYDNQSPSYAFVETAGRFKDGTGTKPGVINESEKGNRKIRADIRCNYFKDVDNPSSPQRTWLVIHGWDNNVDDDSSATPKVFKALKTKYPNDRILALDWSEAASNQGKPRIAGPSVRGSYYAATWIRPVAEATVQQLREKYGIDDLSAVNNLNIIGHSLGSLMAAEIGSIYSGGVRSITALDPPSEINSLGDTLSVLGGYDTDGRTPAYKAAPVIPEKVRNPVIDTILGRDLIRANIDRPKCFGTNNISITKSSCTASKRVAQFSRAFVGQRSFLGNQSLAASADESFQIDFGPLSIPTEEHGNVVKIFTEMISRNKFGGFLGLDDLNLHPEIIRGGKYGHSGMISAESLKDENLSATELVLEHQVKNSLRIEPDGRVYYRSILSKIKIPGFRPYEPPVPSLAGTVQTIFNVK